MNKSSGKDLADGSEIQDQAPELQVLLTGYARVLDRVDRAPVIFWARLRRPRLLQWLPVPVLSRVVRAFYLRYVYRCVNALKRDMTRQSALIDGAGDSSDDLDSVQRFEQSLPAKARLAFIWPLVLLGLLITAYLLAFSYDAEFRTLLGDLTSAAVNLNRAAAIEAVHSAHRLAIVGVKENTDVYPYDILFFSIAIMIVAWAAFLVLVPLLSAHGYYRRLIAESKAAERGFPALSSVRGPEIELDLVAYTLLLPGVAVFAYNDFFHAALSNSSRVPIKGILYVVLIALAGIEVLSRYVERRYDKKIRRGLITEIALVLTTVLSLCLLLYSPYHYYVDKKTEDRWKLTIVTHPPTGGNDHTTGYLYNQAYFIITDIKKSIHCDEQYGPLIEKPQFLKFDLETWSAVDRFATPDIATALLLRNWSVLNPSGTPTGNLLLNTKCSQGTDAIARPLVAGTHTKTTVVVTAPEDAACLQLAAPSYHAVWLWPIPGGTCPEQGLS